MVSHKRMAQGDGVRRNPELVGADRLAGFLKAVSNGAIDGVTRGLEREYLDGAEYRFELGREMRQVFLGGLEAQFAPLPQCWWQCWLRLLA